MRSYYIFTISATPQIIDMFQAKENTWYFPDAYFLGSKFSSKEEALNFAYEVERLKFENGEFNQMIKATHDKSYFPCLNMN